MKKVLATQRYPRDDEFKKNFMTATLYSKNTEMRRKTKVILDRLELFGNKESVNLDDSAITIEHIMPQTIEDKDNWWINHLGKNWQHIYEELCNTIGNLTLTGYNPELSNASFPQKQEILKDSNLKLNRWFANLKKWNEITIRHRAEALAENALEIWSYFGSIENDFKKTEENIKGKKPVAVVILGQTFEVSSWRDVMQNTLETIADVDPEMFDRLANQFPRYISWDVSRFRKNRQLANGACIEINLSATAIYKICVRIIEVSGLSKADWYVEYLSN